MTALNETLPGFLELRCMPNELIVSLYPFLLELWPDLLALQLAPQQELQPLFPDPCHGNPDLYFIELGVLACTEPDLVVSRFATPKR